MKLGEALNLRKDLTTRIASLEKLISNNLSHEKDAKPEVDVSDLFTQRQALLEQRASLISRINRTNVETKLGDDESSVMEAIVLRDYLQGEKEFLRTVAAGARSKRDRSYGGEVVEYVGAVSSESYRKAADDAAAEFRQVDVKLQEINWTTDLID